MKKVYLFAISTIAFTFSLVAQTTPFTFIHLSDIHISTVSSAVNACDINGVEAACYLHTFNTMNPKPAFILATGDISNIGNSTAVSGGMYSALTQYLYPQGLINPGVGALFIDSAKTIPFYASPGNHDYYTTLLPPGTLTQLNTLPNYSKYIAPDSDYVVSTDISVILFMRSGWDISYLISLDPKGSGMTAAQIDWMRSVLMANSNKRKIIVMHHPPADTAGYACNTASFSGNGNDSSSSFYYNRLGFLNLCDSFNVDLILAGHVHQNSVCDRHGRKIDENCTTCGTRYVQTGPAFAGCYRSITVDSSFVTVSLPMQSCPTTTTGLDEEKELEISVYPDPSNGLFNVSLGQTVPVKLKVYNLMGECVYQQSANSSNIQIDMRTQPSGMYFMQLVADQDGVFNTYNFKYSLVITR